MKTKFNEVASSGFVRAVGLVVVTLALLPAVCLGAPIDMGKLKQIDGVYYLQEQNVPYSGEYYYSESEDYVTGKMKNGVKLEEKRDGLLGLTVQSYKDGKPYGVEKHIYKNGKLKQGDDTFISPSGDKIISNYKNGLMQYMKLFSEDGKLYSIKNYKDGVIAEEKTFYDYEKGKLLNVANYKDGKPHGEHKMFYANGNLNVVINYNEGIPLETKVFYENGKLKSIANYKDGKPHGEQKEFDINGNVTKAENYVDGISEAAMAKANIKEGAKAKAKESQTRDKYGRAHGEWKEFYDNGNLKTVTNYNEGKLHGEFKTFHENGNLKQITNYDDHKQTETKMFDKNGKLQSRSVTSYNDGKPAETKSFDANGNLQSETNYNEGVLQEQKSYHANGKLQSVINYKGGKSEMKMYDANGNLQSITNYNNGVRETKMYNGKEETKNKNLETEVYNENGIGTDMENDAVKKWKTLSNQNDCRTTAPKSNNCPDILDSWAKELLKLEKSQNKTNYDASLPVILDYIKYFPNAPAAPNMLFQAAFILESKNEHAQALKLRQQLIIKYPNHALTPLAWLRVGEYYYNNSKWKEAIKSYERITNNATIDKKESSYAIYHLAESYYNMGECRIATHKFQEYIDGAAKNKYISDLRNGAMAFIAKCK